MAREIAALHNGSLTLSDAPGGGARLSLSCPNHSKKDGAPPFPAERHPFYREPHVTKFHTTAGHDRRFPVHSRFFPSPGRRGGPSPHGR
ncbi:MAG: hypothetical protein ACLSAF_01700 [Intestinimonas sp.]